MVREKLRNMGPEEASSQLNLVESSISAMENLQMEDRVKEVLDYLPSSPSTDAPVSADDPPSSPSTKANAPPPNIPGLERLLADVGHWIVGDSSFWKEIRPIMDTNKKVILNTKFVDDEPWYIFKIANPKFHMWDMEDNLIMTMTRYIEFWDVGKGYHIVIKRLLMKHSPDNAKIGYALQSHPNPELYQLFDHNDEHLYNVEKFKKKTVANGYYKIKTPDGKEIGTVRDNKGVKHHVKMPPETPLTHKAMILSLACYFQRIFNTFEDEYLHY